MEIIYIKLDWNIIFIFSLIASGGIIASSIEVFVSRVGSAFKKNGYMNILGGMLGLGAIIASPFFNPWWSIFLVIVISIFLSRSIIGLFGVLSTFISVLMLLSGVIMLLLYLV